ncbi:hypothetical protein ACI2OX_03305 [Bacillus sp. N9]
MIQNVIDFHAHFPVEKEPFIELRKLHPKVMEYQHELRKDWRRQFKFESVEGEHPGNEKQAERWRNELEKMKSKNCVCHGWRK